MIPLMLGALVGCASAKDAVPVTDSAAPAPAAAPLAAAAPAMTLPIEGVEWRWVRTLSSADSTWEPPEGARFTLLFQDGRGGGGADCNRFSAPYTLDGRALSFGAMATTKAYCGPESLGDRYTLWLSQVASHFTRGDTLFLELKFDSGTMVFLKDGRTGRRADGSD